MKLAPTTPDIMARTILSEYLAAVNLCSAPSEAGLIAWATNRFGGTLFRCTISDLVAAYRDKAMTDVRLQAGLDVPGILQLMAARYRKEESGGTGASGFSQWIGDKANWFSYTDEQAERAWEATEPGQEGIDL